MTALNRHLFLLVIQILHFKLSQGNLPPEFTSDLRPPLVREDTPVGTPILTLAAKDHEGGRVRYGLQGSDSLKVDSNTGVVTITKPLDREEKDTLRLVVTVEDEVPGADNNIVRVPLELVVLDVNDNPPIFSRNAFEVTVPEDASMGYTILKGIMLSDVDQVGDTLGVACLDNGKPSEDFDIIPEQMTSRSLRGSLILKSRLSYTARNNYKLALVASDGENMVTAPLTINVKDIQNTPPKFHGSRTGIISEDAPIGSLVMTLQADDGDVGDPRTIMYELIKNPLGFFLLDPESGELLTAKPLDRESVPDPAGVLILTAKAYETVGGSRAKDNHSETTVTISVTIQDVNDEAPAFNKKEYRVFIPENLPPDTPVPDLDMVVKDTDVGSNSVFALRLSDSSGRFSLSPEGATGSTSVSLKVSRGGLDYENPNERKFILLVVAEESLTTQHLSSTATIIVAVTDTNDNPPTFAQEAYTAMVSETASGGTVVTTIGASDPDTGPFGTEGIRYSLFGNGAERFVVDPASGVITVSPCETPGKANCLDYETRPTYFLSLEATDEFGEGQTAVVPLRISLRDVNDNPPKFSREIYRAVIQEGAADFEPPLYVKALDPDRTSRIRYSLVGGDPKELFKIDETSGRIQVSNPKGLDISNMKNNELILTVEASDGSGSHSAKIRLSVQDVNNNSPVFSENVYEASVQENAPISTVIEVVVATDADSGVNAELLYRIMKGGYDDFSINEKSGEVFVSRRLNFDVRKFYEIEIVASDQGIPRQSSSVILKVKVIDNNDKNPYFVPTTQRVKVKEDTSPGSVIHTLLAKDLDVSTAEGLEFALKKISSAVDNEGSALSSERSESLQSLFTVSKNGQVALNAPLNRNITTEITLDVTVTDITANPPQIGHGYLVVTVVDVNDNPPTFQEPWSPENPYIRVTVTEELPLGSVITTITASDVDSNIRSYGFVEPSEALSIDEVTGVVTVKGRLDYETAESVSATVVVKDTGVPQLSSTATLIVKLENINDEEPMFEAPIYDGSVKEHSQSGTKVLRVKAVDKDKDHLGTITYSLAGDHKQYFVIDSSGEISVAQEANLDREILAEMRLRAVATDSGPQDTRRQTSVPVHIKIEDINDHSPHFDQKVFTASVVENLPLRPPIPVLQVRASDGDEGLNAALSYTISGGTGKDLFQLDSTSGILYPAQRLMAPEKEEIYDLNIEVRDMNGTGSTADTAKVMITVLPKNEHKPVFITPAYPAFKVSIPEEASEPEMLVLTVQATDGDRGSNGEVRYHLRVSEKNVQETDAFRIDPISGELRTKGVLDREKVDRYELVLVAKDQGSPISYETLRVVTVIVDDVDDHEPSFPEDDPNRTYSFAIRENLPKGTFVGQVQANDPDLGENARIYYHLLLGNIDESFSIDKSNGNIFTTRSLDRERRKLYEILVKASNDPNSIEAKTQDLFNKNEMVRDSSVALVTITVEDENDTPPKFARDVFYAGVPFSAEVEHMVRIIEAKDDDAGKNGSLTYSIRSSTFYRPGESKPVGSIVPSPFNMTKEGKLMTATLMAPYKRHRFLLEVQAREEAKPHRVDTCMVNILVWERDKLIKVVLEQKPEDVLQRQEEITAELSEVLEGRAVVDEIRYFTYTNNSVSREWTEMLMHVVNNSGNVIPTEEVLQRVDRGYPLLMKSATTARIRNIYPAILSESKAEVDARMAGLIALVVALFIGFVSFIAVCCCLRFWVMTPAKSREHLIHRAVDDDLGLNTTENPLWVEQKLKTYEEQELSMHVMSEFDPSAVNTNPQGIINGGSPHVVNLDSQSNTYATIQKSHGGTLRSLQLRGLQQSSGTLNLGDEPGESNDYATLDHLKMPCNGQSNRQGPRVPGVETPLSAVFVHERESPELQELVTSFTGSTFQPPDGSNMANRPLPEEPLEGRRFSKCSMGFTPEDRNKNLILNANGEPCLVAELI